MTNRPLAVVLAAILAVPLSALAQSNVDEARRHADAGEAALAEHQFQRALSEYQQAYDLFPNALLLVNVARAQSGLNKNRDAIATLGRVLEDQNLDPARRAEVDAELRRLRDLVVELTISVTPDGSQIRVNDDPAGESPLPGPVLVDPGEIEVVVTHPGYRTRRWSQTLEAGARRPVAIALEPENAGTETSETVQEPVGDDVVAPPPQTTQRSNPMLWVTGVGAGVLGAASLAMGGALLSQCGEFRDCDHKTPAYRIIADVMGGVAIVSAGVFVYLLATSGNTEEAAETALREPGTIRF